MFRSFVRNLLYFLVYTGISVMGVIVSVWSFTGIYATVPISMWTAVAGAVVGSAAAIVIYGMRKWAWLGRCIMLAGLAAFVWLKFDMVAGGASYIINYFIDNVNDYYSSGLYYIFLNNDMLKKADQPLAVMLMCMLAGYGYMSVMLRGKYGSIAAFAAALCYLLPATMNNEPSIYNLAGVLAFVVCCIVSGTNSGTEHCARKSGLQAMTWLAAAVLAAIFILTCVVPKEKYIPSESLDVIRGKYVFSIEDLRQYSQNVVNSQIEAGRGNNISEGSIGKIAGIEYEDEPYFLVRAQKEVGTIYLKAFQAAIYTSTQWYELDDEVYEKYSEMFKKINKAGFYPYNQVNDTIDYLMEAGRLGLNVNRPLGLDVSRFNIEVLQYYGDAYSYVPMDALQIDGKAVSSYTEEDRTIHLPSDKKGQTDIQHTYIVTQWRSKTELAKLIEAGASIEGVNQRKYADFVYENYMDVNTTCGDRIEEELLPQIMSYDYDIYTPEGKAAFIKDTVDFFDKGYTYTLRPGTTPSDKDFVEYFLFGTQKGFCTYFASSAVMIFRCAGIPARYVEGYVVPESLYSEGETGNYYEAVVTDRYAHAWVEVYLDGVGWVIVDPTPGYSLYTGDTMTDNEKETEDETQQEESESDTAGIEEESSGEQNESSEEPADTPGRDESAADPPGLGETDRNSGDKHGPGSPDGDNTDIGDDKTDIAAAEFKELLKRTVDAALQAGKALLSIMKIAAIPLAVILFFIFRKKYMEQKRLKLYNGDCGLDNRERVCRIMAYYEGILKFKKIQLSENDSYAEIIARQNHSSKDLNISRLVEKALYSDAVFDDEETKQIMTYVYTYRQRTYYYLTIIEKLLFKFIYAY